MNSDTKNRKNISLLMNGKQIEAQDGDSILEAAQKNGIKIPALCHHPDLEARGSCRLCLVEIKGKKGIFTACSTKAQEGMEVITDSPKIKNIRKINLELIFAQHREECSDCILVSECSLLDIAKECGVNISRFPDRKSSYPLYQFGPALIFDSSKCIDCRNCVAMCQKQGVGFLELEEKDGFRQVVPSKNKKKDCVFCGQCIVHCPAGAFEAVGEFEEVASILGDKKKKVVFQFAPAVRTSIGEEFGMEPGSVVTGNLVAALKQAGAYKVFDTSVGADFTTMEEAGELLEKIETGNYPCFTSCCPAWVKFIEFNYPKYASHLATTRSPQIILGGLIKTYWAKKEGINPKEITVVSIMPCVAKKYEIKKDDLKIDGLHPVDYVITTREAAFLLKKKGIDLKDIIPQEMDDPLGMPAGAGVIYGASGGVAESALRTAYYKITGKDAPKIEFEEVRGLRGVKKAQINLAGKQIRMVVVNGLGNIESILDELEKDPKAYHAVEVMSCLGGCIGGGGQPLPDTPEIRQARAKALYSIDSEKKLRAAHNNEAVKKIYEEFFSDERMRKKICHTSYSRKKREVKIN